MKIRTHRNLFIVGAQRSGNTLLRLILNAHSKIAIPEEAEFLVPLLRKKYLSSIIQGDEYKKLVYYLENNPQFKLWNYDSSEFFENIQRKNRITLKDLLSIIYSSYIHEEEKKIWGDKTPVFSRKIDILKNLFPEALFIHIVRDGRDVFDSWRKMDPSKDNIAVTAIDWCYKIFRVEKSLSKINDEHKMVIRYEDLIELPKKTVKVLCKKIGVEFEINMLQFYNRSKYYIGDHHSKLIFKPLDPKNKQKWRKNLQAEEVEIYNFIASRFLKKYGYEVGDTLLSVRRLVSIIMFLKKGLPQKIKQVIFAKKAYKYALANGKSLDKISIGKMPSKRK